MLDQVLSWLVVVVPVLLGLVVMLVPAKQEDKRRHMRWRYILGACLIVYGGLSWWQQSRAAVASDKEVQSRRQEVEDLKAVMQANEVKNAADMSYLKAKLEDADKMNDRLSKFAPAIMKLAEASAEFTRKQYENKVTTDRELYAFTMKTVKKIRDFSRKYSNLDEQAFEQLVNDARRPNLTQAQRAEAQRQDQEKLVQLNFQKDAEFRNSILSDAIYARQELLRRKLSEPALSQMEQSNVDMILHSGMLAGAYPELSLADYLEVMAKPLSQK